MTIDDLFAELARHSDVRLTLGIYPHVGLHDQTAAIAALPPPPSGGEKLGTDAAELRAMGTEGRSDEHLSVPSLVPSGAQIGAQIGAQRPASDRLQIASDCTEARQEPNENGDPKIAASPDRTRRCRTGRHQAASLCTEPGGSRARVSPTGLEPVTFGSGGRRSIQLSYGDLTGTTITLRRYATQGDSNVLRGHRIAASVSRAQGIRSQQASVPAQAGG